MGLLRTFAQLSAKDTALAGGKGASLGEMTRAGLPVPPGFVITAPAFDQFLAETDLTQEVEAVLSKVKHEEMHTVEEASKVIQALIMQAAMPKDLKRAITKEFKKLGATFVAVRSSATAEDSSAAAWAGQLDTFLNTTEDKLLENVQRCWASLFTPRAIFYRFEKDLHTTAISVAVVIQKMVQSEVSGVAFSVHPVTEDHNQLIIEAGFGLGEAIVSGQVTPDSYVVTKSPRVIIDKNIAVQDRALHRNPAGENHWIDLTPEHGGSQALSDALILELTAIILKIEQHYGFPCDIEWAREGGKFYITQSRPITTLSSGSSDVDVTAGIVGQIRAMKWERWLERPFGAFVLSLFENASRKETFEAIGIPGVELKTQLFQQHFWYLNHEKMEEMDRQLEVYLKKHTMLDITANLERFKKENIKKITDLINASLPVEKKLEQVVTILTHSVAFIWLAHGLESFFQRRLNKEVPKFVLKDVEKFIGDASFPSKKNAHAHFEEKMRTKASDKAIAEEFGWLKSRDGFSAPFTPAEVRAMRAELAPTQKHIAQVIPKALQPLFDQVRELVFFRTERTDVFYQLFFLARPIIQAMGKKLGLPYGELQYYHARSLIESAPRRYDPEFSFAYLHGESLFQNEPLLLQKTDFSGQKVTGTVAYKGKAQGIVRIVRTVDEIVKVQTGDILVTQMTFPSFIPAMIKAAAFVTDEGGITCHAAIVAREMKKPCVIGTKNATSILKDGDVVEVDADSGIVRKLVEKTPSPAMMDLEPMHLIHSVEREYPPLLMGLFFDGLCDLKRFSVVTESQDCFHLFVGDNGRLSFSKEDFDRLTALLVDKDARDLRYLDRFAKRCYAWGTSFVRLGNKLVKNKYTKASLPTLFRDVKAFMKGYKDVGPFLQYAVYIDHLLKSKLDALIKAKSKNPEHDYIVLGGPDRENFDFEEVRDLLKIAIKATRVKNWQHNAVILKKIDQHVQRYAWIATRGGARTAPWDRSLITQRLTGYLAKDPVTTLKHHLTGRVECRRETKRLIRAYKMTADEKALIRHIKEFVYLRTYRTDIMAYVTYQVRPLFTEFGKRFGLTYWQTQALIEREVLALSERVPNTDELEKRLRSFRLVHIGRDVAEIISLSQPSNLGGDRTAAITGTCGYPGVMRGTVKVVRDSTDQDKVRSGDILVAIMTFPNLIPCMERAAAFITDEGGILCHAAIIAREMKKPCVIGTKNATQILQDNDLVEIDAAKGIVKII